MIGSVLYDEVMGWESRYFLYDGLGSVVGVVDASGMVADSYTYSAYGELLYGTFSTDNNYQFTGEWFDDDLGMYFLRARHYAPENGRFWTMDTYEGSRKNPVSLHKYLYANGNPITYIDPSGMFGSVSELSSVTYVIGALAVIAIPSIQYVLVPAVQNLPVIDLSPSAIFRTVANTPAIDITPRARVLPFPNQKGKNSCEAIIGESAKRVVHAKFHRFINAEIFAWDESFSYLLDQGDSPKYPGYGSVLEAANFLWITNIMARGCHIYDIGFDVDRVSNNLKPSETEVGYFYLAELEWTRGYTNKSFHYYPGRNHLIP